MDNRTKEIIIDRLINTSSFCGHCRKAECRNTKYRTLDDNIKREDVLRAINLDEYFFFEYEEDLDMNKDSLEEKLAAAHQNLEKADRQIEALLKELEKNQMVIEILEAAGFITEGKLQEALEFVRTFKT
jgi:DNA replicative helicase MCM subunit Mcm2 (Cdc46/Mcm family)